MPFPIPKPWCFRERRFTYRVWQERTWRVANHLRVLGLGCHRPRGELEHFIQVADDSGNELLPDAVDYEAVLAACSAEPIPDDSPDDLYILYTGGTTELNASLKVRFLEHLPALNIVDGLGSSETGGQGSHISNREAGASTGRFTPGADNVIIDEAMSRVLGPGHDGMLQAAEGDSVPRRDRALTVRQSRLPMGQGAGNRGFGRSQGDNVTCQLPRTPDEVSSVRDQEIAPTRNFSR